MTSQELIELLKKHKVDEKIYLFQWSCAEDAAFKVLYKCTKETNLKAVGDVVEPKDAFHTVNTATVIQKEGIYKCYLLRKGLDDTVVYAFVWWNRKGHQRGRVVSINDTTDVTMGCMKDFLERKDA
jgi:hypothetical protein